MGKRDSYELVPEDNPEFARFWSTYPKRVAKKEARRAWARLKPSAETVDQMLEALSWQMTQTAWTKEGGAYIPYPASWLRGERWTDDRLPAAERPMTPDERARAITARKAYGGCLHDPRCASYEACLTALVQGWR